MPDINNIFFPEAISKIIINHLFSGEKREWVQNEKDLDEIIPRIIRFGYENIPGIRIRMEKEGITPDQINDFKDYENYFPDITIIEMAEIGQNKFELKKNYDLSSRSNNFYTFSDIILREQVGEKSNKRSGMIKVQITEADARASILALSGYLKRQKNLPERILINQKIVIPEKDPLLGDYLLGRIILPAFELLGIKTCPLNSLKDLDEFLTRSGTGLFLPGEKYVSLESIDLSNFDFIVSSNSDTPTSNAVHIGDYYQNIGLYPILGFNSPALGLLRVVDSGGRIPREKSSHISTIERGISIVDRFVSAYEIPNEWSLLKNCFDQIFDLLKVTGIREVSLKKTLNEIGGEKILNLFMEVDLNKNINIDIPIELNHFLDIYSQVQQKYFDKSVRIGMPSSTWLLKIRLPFAAKIDNLGILRSIIPLESGREGYVLSKSWKVKYSSRETPYTNFNIIGHPNEMPELISSNIRNRVLDSLGGRELFGSDNPGYLYSVSVVSPKEFFSMIDSAKDYSLQPPSSAMTLEEIVQILGQLHSFIEEELKKTYRNEMSIITLFAEKTRIPISEIAEMNKRAKTDFIDKNGISLKKILYSAFINQKEDFDTLSLIDLEAGVRALEKKKPNSPAFMVTPGNITLYDSFCLFAHLLFPTLSDQSKNKFTIYLRPSESDITFNCFIYKFFEIAREIDPKNELDIPVKETTLSGWWCQPIRTDVPMVPGRNQSGINSSFWHQDHKPLA